MPLSFSLASTAADKVEADLLAVPVFGADELGPGGAPVDKALGGGLAAFMEEAGFEGKPGQTLAVPTNASLGAKAALLVGVGPQDDLTVDRIRNAAAALARRAKKVESARDDAARRRAGRRSTRPRWRRRSPRASRSAATSTSTYKSDGKPSKLAEVIVLGRGGAAVSAAHRSWPGRQRSGDLGPRRR